MEKAKVYFTKNLSSESLVNIYKHLGIELKGNVMVKVHSGESGNQNFLHPEYFKDIINYVKATVVECNTAYQGRRNETKKHKKLLNDHGWSKYFNVDLLDEIDDDIVLKIENGNILKENYIGHNTKNYDSMLVLSHFKGHPMGGFGGAIKQLSIGLASSRGKAWIHSAGKTKDPDVLWDNIAPQNDFLASMADAASSVVKYFGNNTAYINVMANMSVDCDCCAKAEDPCMKDIGILASTDPVAIDKACIDLVYNSADEGSKHLIKRIERQNGTYIFEAVKKLDFGSLDYELIDIDKETI